MGALAQGAFFSQQIYNRDDRAHAASQHFRQDFGRLGILGLAVESSESDHLTPAGVPNLDPYSRPHLLSTTLHLLENPQG